MFPCLDDVCSLIPGLDRLGKLSSAADVLEKQEVEWPKNGKINQYSIFIMLACCILCNGISI